MANMVGKIGRGLGWVSVAIVSFLLGAGVAFVPLSLLPGPIQTDFVHGQWIKLAGIGFVGAILVWRLAPLNEDRSFSAAAGGKIIWLTVSAFALSFWPLGLATWFNAYHSALIGTHDMVVTGMESATARPGGTPIESFEMRDVSSGWAANLEVTDDRKRFASPGHCVRLWVRSGRLGLDWISDARPIPCPPTGGSPVRSPGK